MVGESRRGSERSEVTPFPGDIIFLHDRLPLPTGAEKYFKALLTWYQIEFPKTHDLGLLLGLVSSVDSSLGTSLHEVSTLNQYGVDIRYPSDVPEITSEDSEEAVELAEKVKEEIHKALEGKI